MKKFLFVILLTFCFGNTLAIEPNVLVGKPFTFNHEFTNNWGYHDDIKLDCFYNYTSSSPIKKLVNNKNRYYPNDKKGTIADSLYRHRFEGVYFLNEPKKESYFIMTDDKGDSLFMVLPKFDANKEYISYKKSYAYKNIRTIKKWYENFDYHYLTAVDLTAYPLFEFETRLDTILSTQQIAFSHPALPIPKYSLNNLYYVEAYENRLGRCLPYVTLVRNSTDTLQNLKEDDIIKLSSEVSDLYRKITVLKNYISSFDNSLFDSIAPYLNQNIWLDSKLFNDAVFLSPSSYHGNEYYSESNSLASWYSNSNGTLSSAALGGPTYQFNFAHLSGIVLKQNLRTIVEKRKFQNDRRCGSISYKAKFMPSDSSEFRYYLALTHIPDSLYATQNKYGREFNDTIFIQLDENTISNLLTQHEFASIKNGFYEREQAAWDEFSEEQRAYREIASRAWGNDIAQIVCRGEVRLGFNEDMCLFAFMRIPYRESSAHTPLGSATCKHFFTEDIKLYFQNKVLIGIEWRGNTLFEPRHRY